MKEDQEKCLAAGANDYLAKPIELERLFSLMRVLDAQAGAML
jgi:CheY-like chemotaxis protein